MAMPFDRGSVVRGLVSFDFFALVASVPGVDAQPPPD